MFWTFKHEFGLFYATLRPGPWLPHTPVTTFKMAKMVITLKKPTRTSMKLIHDPFKKLASSTMAANQVCDRSPLILKDGRKASTVLTIEGKMAKCIVTEPKGCHSLEGFIDGSNNMHHLTLFMTVLLGKGACPCMPTFIKRPKRNINGEFHSCFVSIAKL